MSLLNLQCRWGRLDPPPPPPDEGPSRAPHGCPAPPPRAECVLTAEQLLQKKVEAQPVPLLASAMRRAPPLVGYRG